MPQAVVLAPELRDLAAQLARLLGDPRLAAAATAAVAHRAPDERLALATLLKLVEESPAELRAALDNEAIAGDLALCVGGSEIIAQELGAMGSRWLEFFLEARDASGASIDSAIRFAAGPSADRHEAARRLGEFKLRRFVQIAIADLVGGIDVAATMGAMSRLADECISAALACSRLIVGSSAPVGAAFCVLAMGKLGAQELNLSSDIDLIYVFDGPNDGAEAAARLGQTLTELLSVRCFRVDMRLRPGGRNAPLVTSFEGALSFYQNFGETWERAALLRARPVAGAFEVGRRLLGELAHFVYRRYLDFDTLRQLRAMKTQIERELRAPVLVQRNIKLGYGGIRELEFIVQALILVYGGRDPRLRSAQTLAALERLGALGYLDPARARELEAAYLFLRDVEHKLQVVAALQTHVLPADDAGRRALAARMNRGKDSAAQARFEADLKSHRARVAEQFREMLGAAEDRGGRVASEAAERAWRAAVDPRQSTPMLQALRFARAEDSARHLKLLACGPEHAIAAAPRQRELVERLGPLLLDEIRELADPDLALMNLASFIAAIGARSSFLELLEQHPATRRVVLSLFASSAHLSTIFIRHPDMIDTLVRSDLARPRRSLAELDEELRALMVASPDLESRLDAIRAFRHQEFLRIAIADLAGALDVDAVRAELSLLAEVVLRRALKLARAEVAARVPLPPAMELVAVAMGRLGAAEMSYNSDLDLIFVYHDRGEAAEASHLAASRIVQKLIAVLEARTREGYAYKIDLRLRPSGNAGPLVASLDGFRDYHRTSSAAVWERQALVRARVIAGEPELGAVVEAGRREFVFGRGLNRAEVGEIAAMRQRIEYELGADGRGRLNLKQGRGGLVDVEFLTQMMALRYAHAHPELTSRATVALVRGIGQCGLLKHDAAAQLEADYRFLSRLENRLRIETDQAAWELSTKPESLGPLTRRMGYREADGAVRLLAELEACRARIRTTFDECFSIEMSRDG
jgi:glutamate-ammonia-ligase adenylyltransferase